LAYDFPASPITGQIVTGPGGVQWQWDGTKWVVASGSGAGAGVTISDTAPPSPAPGAMWLDSVSGQLYIFYADPNSSQWIPASNQGGAPAILPPGVTNGSNAAAGQIGEYQQIITGASGGLAANVWGNNGAIVLTAGDWDVWGTANFSGTFTATQCAAGFSTTVNAAPSTTYYGSYGFPNYNLNTASIIFMTLTLPPIRVSITATTTVYLNFYCAYGTGSPQIAGVIWARRVR